ncbi:MAG: ankyrin repeat domain-containing protein [Terriglobia bacterium]
MNKGLAVLVSLAIGCVVAGAVMTNVFADGGSPKLNKPIMYLTPAELFSDPKLRALAEAAQHGSVKKIDALIAEGVDVNGHGKYGIGPLFSADQAGSKTGFKALLDRGANPNNIWTNGYTLMNSIACCSHDPYFMEEALKHSGNPNLIEPATQKTPLVAAVTVSGKVNIPALIKAGANLNYQVPNGKQTAMMWAIWDFGQFDIVYELLQSGADYKLKDKYGNDIRYYIKDSFSANVSPERRQWRDKVIEFLKRHSFWSRTNWPENLHVSPYAVSPGDTYVLSWDGVVGADSYDLLLNGIIKQRGLTQKQVTLHAPDMKDTDKGYLHWRVRACSADGCSSWSPIIDVYVRVLNGTSQD